MLTKHDDGRPAVADSASKIVEPYCTLGDAARSLNLTYVQIQRAVRRGIFPSYRPLGRRPLVRLSEIVAVIETFRIGGGDD